MKEKDAQPTFLTIRATLASIKAQDPNTCASEHFLRELCIAGAPFSVKVGETYIINVSKLCSYLYGQAKN